MGRPYRRGRPWVVSAFELAVRDRTVVVAGAGGGGIGTAVSAALVSGGATVVGIDVDGDALAITERAVDDESRFVPVLADVTDAAAIDGALDRLDDLPQLHGLVHVVGGMPIADWSPVTAMAPDRFTAVVE